MEGGEIMSTEVVINNNIQHVATGTGKSYFDGGLLQFIGWTLLGWLVTVFTFAICYPWALTMIYGWKINHTVVEGRRLKFNGSAIGLFGNCVNDVLQCPELDGVDCPKTDGFTVQK